MQGFLRVTSNHARGRLPYFWTELLRLQGWGVRWISNADGDDDDDKSHLWRIYRMPGVPLNIL